MTDFKYVNLPPELAKKALITCTKVDELEAKNASEAEIEEAQEAVNQISKLISQLYYAQIRLQADEDPTYNDDFFEEEKKNDELRD